MPLLGGLFSRKNKSSPRSKRDDHIATSRICTSEVDSALSSPTTSYVAPDESIPTYPNGRSLLHPDPVHEMPSSNVYPSMTPMPIPPTGKKLRLPFARKKNALPRSDLSIASSPNVNSSDFNTSPRSFSNGRVSTSAPAFKADPVDLRRLRPPPSRSAIFAAYGDTTNGPSTHSLPDDSSAGPELSFPSPSPSPQTSKRTSLFSWSKASTSKSSPSTPASPDSADSFNLKSFRHIRAPSPTHSNASNVSLTTTPVTRVRPRGESINSDSSQRISVAAFREAQSRRSLAGSPSPSFRAPSPVPALPPQTSTEVARGRANPQLSYSSQPVQFQNKTQPRGRHSSMALYTSDSESLTSSDDGNEEETIKRRPGISHSRLNDLEKKDKGKAKSEMGHKSVVDDRFAPDSAAPQRAPQSHSGHSRPPSDQTKKLGTGGNGLDFPSRSQPSLGYYTPAPKLQSSISSSPSATAKLAGAQVAPAPNTGAVKSSREPALSDHPNSQNTTQNVNNVPRKYRPVSDSESDSEDDTPLATLLGPRGPGSAMSSDSSLHARSTGHATTRSTRSTTLGPTKPLIDINELTGPRRFTTHAEKSAAGFTQGPTLLSGSRRSMSPNPSDLKQPLTCKSPPVKFVSPPSSPAKEVKQLISHTGDGADSTPGSDPITLLSENSAGPEQPRDALTDRLSRAVNLKFAPSSSNAVGPLRIGNSVSKGPNITAGDTSDNNSRQQSPEKKNIYVPLIKEARCQPSAEKSSQVPVAKTDHSPPDEDLAQLLGTAGIKFMLRSDEIPDRSSESESEGDSSEEVKREKDNSTRNNIAPIPIRQRPPAPSFSVTSRPPFPDRDSVTAAQTGTNRVSTTSNVVAPRPRSITLTHSSTSSTSFHKYSANDVSPSVPSNVPSKSTSNIASPKLKNDIIKPPNVRQRSSTMVTGVPLSVQVQTSKAFHVPERPFAIRRNSPASSTGDSSSGRAPLTPGDGSEIGVQDRKRDEWSGGASGLGVRHLHLKRRSVSFEEDHPKPQGITHSKGKEPTNSNAAINDDDREVRRKERRRSEAKAAIELGNVVNGPAPIVDDEDEINHNISPRMSTFNPTMGMGLPVPMQMGFRSPNSVTWGGNMAQSMHSSSPYLMSPPADPNFLAAHQHAMMYAKQAYQMAVAQQAMAAAGDEWERGSSVGGYGGSGMIGASSSPPHFGMMPTGQGYGWSSPSSVYLPSSSRSMYGGPVNGGGGELMLISNSRSEYGGAGPGTNNWSSSRSSYGESFGPSLDQVRKNAQGLGTSRHTPRDSMSSLRAPVMPAAQFQSGRGTLARSGNGQRDSAHLPTASPMPASQFQSGRGNQDGTPRPRTASQPASPSRSTYGRKALPPSSWKAGM